MCVSFSFGWAPAGRGNLVELILRTCPHCGQLAVLMLGQCGHRLCSICVAATPASCPTCHPRLGTLSTPGCACAVERPEALACGHAFCRCIVMRLSSPLHRPECPTCHRPDPRRIRGEMLSAGAWRTWCSARSIAMGGHLSRRRVIGPLTASSSSAHRRVSQLRLPWAARSKPKTAGPRTPIFC